MSDFDLLDLHDRMGRAQATFRRLLLSSRSRPDEVAEARSEADRLELEWEECLKAARSGSVSIF